MKTSRTTSRTVVLILGAFLLGYAAHGVVDEVRLERRRASLEEYYRRVFRIGQESEKVAAQLREQGLHVRFVSELRRYDITVPPDYTARLSLYIEMDEKQRIKNVRVARVVVM